MLKRAGNCGLHGQKLLQLYDLTGCVNAHTMHLECRVLETKQQFQFLSEMARIASCL